jgi:pSer/pThr/pTyr-binding forkhead associated (FHA) protein
MEQMHAAVEANAHSLQGPHKDPRQETPPGFNPLRLLLLPGGLCVEMTRPNMLVGRHSEADVRLALPDVSRRHCRFLFQHGNWKVIDLDSTNGVFVNGERMHEATLYDGDQIRLGSFLFAVRLEAPSRPMPHHSAEEGILERIKGALPKSGVERGQRKAS